MLPNIACFMISSTLNFAMLILLMSALVEENVLILSLICLGLQRKFNLGII